MKVPRILLVEGKTEQFTLPELAELAGFPWERGGKRHVEIRACGSDAEVLGDLKTALKSKVEAIGVVLDADSDAPARWAAVNAVYAASDVYGGQTLVPTAEGAVALSDGFGVPFRFGAWVMPDNFAAGMLEDLVLTMCNENPKLRKHCEEAVVRANALGATFKHPLHRAKALTHTWLAWVDEPGTLINHAVKHGKLGAPPPSVQHFAKWMSTLFG